MASHVLKSALLQVIGLRIGNAPAAPLHEPTSFTVNDGERVAVVGPSGVGKTTLQRTVCGLQDPLEGAVKLQGKAPDQWGWPEYRSRIVLVSQRPALLAATAEENLRLPFSYTALKSKSYQPDRARTLLERLGLNVGQLTQPATTLSIGEQQRFCIIRALLMEPLVLCLDEPTGALDTSATAAVESLIDDECSRTGLAALIVTHNPEQASRWCAAEISLQRPALGELANRIDEADELT